LPTGGNIYYVGSMVPYGGVATNGNAAGGGLNFGALNPGYAGSAQDFTALLQWSPTMHSYTGQYLTDSGSPSGWDDSNFDPTNAPVINVGDGFIVIPAASNYTWAQGL